jgi:hypothetical protein
MNKQNKPVTLKCYKYPLALQGLGPIPLCRSDKRELCFDSV